jgi:Beta-propeller repeat
MSPKEISIMFPTLRTLWRTLSGKALRKDRPGRRPAGCRPLLEVLEDRAVPASLSWSTGSFNVYATAVDSAGNVYITGTPGSNFSATPGAFETSGGGAYVAKLSPTGAVIYATYLGVDNMGGNDGGYGIAVDTTGDAYVIGQNLNVPTTANAIASSAGNFRSGGTDFVAELNPTGSSLLYGTYLPGTLGYSATLGNAGGIAVDGSGNIYVAGSAIAGFPVTAGAFQTSPLGGTGGQAAFFAKINPALSGTASLVYATYLGGNSGLGDAATGIALDGSGNAYLTGYTSSSNFPTTTEAFQKTFGGDLDAFVAKFNPSLSGAASLVYSTYLGGSGQDGYVFDDTLPYDNLPITDGPQTDGGITVNAAGDVYVTGSTTSTNFPTTKGAFQTTSNLTYKKGKSDSLPADAFVTELNPAGSALVYSTYLGGGTNTWSGGAGITLDANGDAELTGWTSSTVFPTKDPIQATNSGGYNAFVTVLNPSGSGLIFSTYLGGSMGGGSAGMGIALNTAGDAFVGGTDFVADIDPPAGPGPAASPQHPAAGQAAALAKPSSTIVQVGFYLDSNKDGTLEQGTDTFLGDATQSNPGIWTLTNSSAFGLTAGTYRLFARAEDSNGVFGDPVALTLTVQ